MQSKPAGQIEGLLIFETPTQGIEESSSGPETKKSYDICTADGSIRTTDEAFRSFGRWVNAFARFDSFYNQPKQVSFNLDPKSVGNHWTAEITWGTEQRDSNNKTELAEFDVRYNLRFSTKGGRKTRRIAYRQAVYIDGGWADDVTCAIGTGGEGVEVDSPAISFQVSDRFPYDWLSPERKMNIASMTGQTVNADEFMGYPPGWVRFLGMDTTLAKEFDGDWAEVDGVPYKMPSYYWDATFDFAVQGPREEQTDDGQTLQVDPWVHVWAETEDADYTDENGDDYTGVKVRRYHAAQIYFPADYGILFD